MCKNDKVRVSRDRMRCYTPHSSIVLKLEELNPTNLKMLHFSVRYERFHDIYETQLLH